MDQRDEEIVRLHDKQIFADTLGQHAASVKLCGRTRLSFA